MPNNNNQSGPLTPKSVGIGGSFYSLISAFSGLNQVISFKYLCPVWAIFLFPLSIFFPVLTPLIILHAIKQRYQDSSFVTKILNTSAKSVFAQEDELSTNTQNQEQTNSERLAKIKEQESEHKTLLESLYQYIASLKISNNIKQHRHILIGTQIVWYLAVLAIYHVSSYVVDQAVANYIKIAKTHKVLQIATPEQLAMSNTITTVYACALGIGLLIMIMCMFTSVVCACNFKFKQQKLKHFFLKNAPSIVVILTFSYALITIIERYFAHYKMIAIEAMLQNQPYFDPSWPFILLRLYVGNAIIMAFILMIFMSLSILPSSFKTKYSK